MHTVVLCLAFVMGTGRSWGLVGGTGPVDVSTPPTHGGGDDRSTADLPGPFYAGFSAKSAAQVLGCVAPGRRSWHGAAGSVRGGDTEEHSGGMGAAFGSR